MKNFLNLSIMVLGLCVVPQLSFASSEQGSNLTSADLSVAPEDGVAHPLTARMKELVAKGNSQNSSTILTDTEIKEMKVLINHFGWTALKQEGILTRGDYKKILNKRSTEQRNLWRNLGPQDAMNDIRLSATMRLNKCYYRSQADYFMSLEEDAIGHRMGMAEIYSDNNLLDSERRQRTQALNKNTNGEKGKSKKAYNSNRKKCNSWVREYHAWLKKYEAELKSGGKPQESQPLFVLDVR
jgi:hypothetical protein